MTGALGRGCCCALGKAGALSLPAEPGEEKHSSPPEKHQQSLTLVTVPDGVEVHVVLVVGEEEEAEPRVKGIDGNDEEDPDDVALLPGRAVEAEVHVDLKQTQRHIRNHQNYNFSWSSSGPPEENEKMIYLQTGGATSTTALKKTRLPTTLIDL